MNISELNNVFIYLKMSYTDTNLLLDAYYNYYYDKFDIFILTCFKNKISEQLMDKILLDQLTKRELQTLELLAQGCEYSEIGDKLSISINGVRANIKNIYRKFQVHNNVQAARVYWTYQLKNTAPPAAFRTLQMQE